MKRFSIVSVIFASMMILGLLPGCDFLSLENEIQTVGQIEAFTGAFLPADATNVYYEVGGFQDTIIWMRFDAMPDSVQQYLSDLGFDPLLTVEAISIQPNAPETATWWITEDLLASPDVKAGSSSDFKANLHFQALVDQSDPELWRLYLVAFNNW
jgi:hypothetical protein